MNEDRRWALFYALALTVAVGALAGVLARMTVYVPMDWSYSTVEARLAKVLVGIAVVGLGATTLATFVVIPLYGAVSDRIGTGDVPWLLSLALGAVVCFGVGFGGVQPYAGGFADAHIDTYGGSGPPEADFDVSIEWVGDGRGVVTFTHVGGAPLHAEHVYVKGDNLTAIEGVDHRESGVWNGTVSGERPRRGGPAIVRGDRVTIGVAHRCTVALAYQGQGASGAVAWYRCPELRTDA